MDFDDSQIVLDSPNGTYYSGQTVRGNFIFQQDCVEKFRGIYVQFLGYCQVHWAATESRRVNGRNEIKNHESYEEYVNIKIYLVGGESGEYKIQPGNYDYPFTFEVPANCPSSFEGPYGHIRYEVKLVVDRPIKDQEKRVPVHVIAPLDLNVDPYCREPIEIEMNTSYCCCCFSSGSSDTVVNVPLAGYCPGQKIPIEITCTNKGRLKIDYVETRIVMKIDFIATHYPGKQSDKDVIVQLMKGPIPGNTTHNWTEEMEIPALDIYNLSGCKYITINYLFEVVVSPDGCHFNTDDSRKIIIGTIPLVDLEVNVDPLHEQIPQQTASNSRSNSIYSIDESNSSSSSSYSENPHTNSESDLLCPIVHRNVTPEKVSRSENGLLKTSNIGFTDQCNNISRNMSFPGISAVLPVSAVSVNLYTSAPELEWPNTDEKERK